MQIYTLNGSELRAVQAKKCENRAQKVLQQQKPLENRRKKTKKRRRRNAGETRRHRIARIEPW